MKKQVRKGVWETNSSSVHAICISKDNYELPKFIKFKLGEYGWSGYCEDTASYLLTGILGFEKSEADEYLKKLKDILDSHSIKYDLDFVNDLQTFTCGNSVYYDTGYCYVDHAEELKGFLDDILVDEDKLFRFLFSGSYVEMVNDNSGPNPSYNNYNDYDVYFKYN